MISKDTKSSLLNNLRKVKDSKCQRQHWNPCLQVPNTVFFTLETPLNKTYTPQNSQAIWRSITKALQNAVKTPNISKNFLPQFTHALPVSVTYPNSIHTDTLEHLDASHRKANHSRTSFILDFIETFTNLRSQYTVYYLFFFIHMYIAFHQKLATTSLLLQSLLSYVPIWSPVLSRLFRADLELVPPTGFGLHLPRLYP